MQSSSSSCSALTRRRSFHCPCPILRTFGVVEVLHSEPLRIEYVVESASGERYAGELAVSGSATTDITATRLRPLP